jgi:hypothetical protein
VSLSKRDQERYTRLAALEEQPKGEPTPGSSVHGADAAALGQQMLLEALGDPAAVTKAVGGRPRVGGSVAGDGESPTLRVRVTRDRKHDILVLRHQLGMKHDSDVVRAAIDEFVDRHLQASA